MFKQYIFLLILSLFSIQGFAAGCPDGSEPVKSISADGTYFVFECINNTQNSSSANQNYDITIVNKSSFPTKTLQEWADSASSKMASRESDILVLLYDVGQVINPVKNLYGSFRLHQVLMSPKEINESKKLIEDWFINSGCSGGADYGLMNDIKVGLDKGLDWSSQWTLCTNKRLIVMALPEEMRSNPNGQDAVFIDIQGFLQHELYHAFQHDLANTGECRNRRDKKNSNSSWMIEGGARYFAERLLPFPKADFKDLILRPIYENKMVLGDAEDVVGAAILLLMIERGLINESEIMDGSLFHDCARELKFDKNSDEMKFVLSNWNNEEYEFSPEILLDYDASKVTTNDAKKMSKEQPEGNIKVFEDPQSDPFVRYIDVQNLRLYSLDEVSNKFLQNVAKTYLLMLETNNQIDPEMRAEYLKITKDNYVYQRIGLEGPEYYENKFNSSFDGLPESRTLENGPYRDNVTDYIWEYEEGSDRQINEVIEHLLHTITNVIFSMQFTNWDWENSSSMISLATQEAIDKGIFNISDYKEILNRGDKEGFNKVITTEFAYWLIAAEWGLGDFLGMPNSEFRIGDRSKIEEILPLGHSIYKRYVEKILSPPRLSNLLSIFPSNRKINNQDINNKSEEYSTVDYNTNLLEICKRDVEGNWKNDIKDAPYMFAVAGEDGRCEYGLGDTENGAFEDCTKYQEENNIVGTCELYGKDGEVVWDGHLKPSK